MARAAVKHQPCIGGARISGQYRCSPRALVGCAKSAGTVRKVVMRTRPVRRGAIKVQQQLQLPVDPTKTEANGEWIAPAKQAETRPYPTVPELWARLAKQYPDELALHDPHASPATKLTFAELQDAIFAFGAGLAALGLRRGDTVALFAENSWKWMVSDQGVMANGAVDAVRGSTSPPAELAYILQHSDCSGLVVQNAATLEKLMPHLGQGGSSNGAGKSSRATRADQAQLRFVVVLEKEVAPYLVAQFDCPVLTFDEVLAKGCERKGSFTAAVPAFEDTATLVFTSGTTGNPKGVVLSHGNLAYQLSKMPSCLQLQPGGRALSLLPPWHIYERTCSYYLLSQGCHLVYSSIRRFRDDLQQSPPDYFVCVPLVLDTLYTKVMTTLRSASALRRTLALSLLAVSGAYVAARRVVDGCALQYAREPPAWHVVMRAAMTVSLLKPLHKLAGLLVYRKIRTALGIRGAVISGGGSLAAHLDDFYESIGLPVLNGWGLTETSPVLACRRNTPRENVRGSVGLALPGTQVRVVDPDTKADVPDGSQGLLLVRGPGVTAGYHKDTDATARAFPLGDGWFDTGDLGWRAPAGVARSAMAGCIVLSGRAKDTIVLSSGKNVEPQPLEDLVAVSNLVQAAVVVGQGRRRLGALVAPNADAFATLATERGLDCLPHEEALALVTREVRAALAGRAPWEQVAEVALLPEPLSPDNGTLTRTMKPRRAQIFDKYRDITDALLAKLR